MGLIRIGESLHCHIPTVQNSARRWLRGDSMDRMAGERHLISLVQDQVAAGADYLDVNVDNFLTEDAVGMEGAQKLLDYMLELMQTYGGGTPPCVDSSNPDMLIWGLRRYHERTGGHGRTPLINSVSISRLDPLELRSEFPFSAIGMLLEKAGDEATGFTDIAGPEVYHETARSIFDRMKAAGFSNDQIFFDPTVGPLGADMVGYTKRTFEGIRSIKTDPGMEGVHVALGLSNCSDGLPRRLATNRAYLRVAMDYGVDAAICDVQQISGNDLCDGRILKLIRQIVEGEATDALTLMVDFAQAHPRSKPPPPLQPLPDIFGQTLRDPDQTVYLVEMAPSESDVNHMFSMAEQLRDLPVTCAITDTPGGNRTPGPDTLGVEIGRLMERQPIVNISCKSDDRNGLIQRVLGLYHHGLRHVFAITGDYAPDAQKVFDLDATTFLWAIECHRRGLEFHSLLPRTGGSLDGLTAGAAVTPFKYSEPHLWGQYLKLWKKRQLGAAYFITQLGFDPAKFQELKLFMAHAGMSDVPLIGSVYYVTPQFLRVLGRIHVAGVYIPEELKDKYRDKLAPAKERRRIRDLNFVEYAAHQRNLSMRRAGLLADILVRGLGYKGIDLAGFESIEDIREVLDLIETLKTRDWRENLEEFMDADGKRAMRLAPEDAFYLFPRGEDGLLTEGPLQTADRSQYERESRRMRWLHKTFFDESGWGSGLVKWASTGAEDGFLLRWTTVWEQAAKTLSLGCEMCGDCRIQYLHYHCPEPTRGCGKRLTNGPCGGADPDGMCEVFPERECYWARVIQCALAQGSLQGLACIQPPKDPKLYNTSSWRNEFLELVPRPLSLADPTGVLP